MFSRNTHRAFLWGGVDSRQIKSHLRVHLHPCTVALHRPSSRFHLIAALLSSHVWRSLFQSGTKFTVLRLLLFGSVFGSDNMLSSHASHRFLNSSAVILRASNFKGGSCCWGSAAVSCSGTISGHTAFLLFPPLWGDKGTVCHSGPGLETCTANRDSYSVKGKLPCSGLFMVICISITITLRFFIQQQ